MKTTYKSGANAAYQHLVQVTSMYSPQLSNCMSDIGPIALQSPTEKTLEEFLAKTIVGQQLSVRAAATIWDRILKNMALHSFSLQELVRYEEQQLLHQAGVSKSKARAIAEVIHAVESGKLTPSKLHQISHKERVSTLVSVWGVGQWTADMTSLFYACDRDVWPQTGIAANNVLKRFLQADEVDIGSAEYLVEECKPFRSYLALFLWRCVDEGYV